MEFDKCGEELVCVEISDLIIINDCDRYVLYCRNAMCSIVLCCFAICHLPEVDTMTFRVNDGTSERSVLHNRGRKRSKSVISSKRPLN
jgi:hypothetical protein